MTTPRVHLREVTDDNREAVCALRVRTDQERFVASVSRSLRDAAAEPSATPGTGPCTATTSRLAS